MGLRGLSRLRAFPVVAAVLTGIPTVALAQVEPSATVEQAIARAASDSMPRSDGSLNWSAFGVWGRRDVFWHLNDPKPYHRVPLPEGVHQRTGWLQVGGRTGDVTICGDADRIGQMSIEVGDLWLGESDVIVELNALGVAATPDVSRTEVAAPDLTRDDEGYVAPYYAEMINRYPARQVWRLEKSGAEPVELRVDYRCTPPGARSATSCDMTWSVLFRPDEPRPDNQPCRPPVRPTDS